MPLPPLVKKLVEIKLAAYCLREIPVALHDEIRLHFKFRGDTVTIFESRPAFGLPDKRVELDLDPTGIYWG